MLPDAWVSKIFSKLEGRYGSLFIDRWRGCDMANVRQTWAEELAQFRDKPECIAYALKSLAGQQFPPTLPEFLTACRRAPEKEAPALPYKPTPEDEERNRIMAQKVAAAVKAPEFDGLLWAKRPRSQKAMDMVADGKRESRRFPALAAVFDQLVANGVANEAGKLLKRWDGAQWVPA